MKIEEDRLEILGGVRHGRTIGSPISLVIHNTEWPKWQAIMSVEEENAELEDPALTRPRPGHADLVGMQKYGFGDARSVLERASARETAARVAVGAVCKSLLGGLGATVLSHVIEVGGVRSAASGAARAGRLGADRLFRPSHARYRRRGGDEARDRGSAPAGRHARRRVRGHRLRPSAGARLARPLGPPHRRPARAGAHEHPGDQGRRGRSRASRWRARRARGRTTRSPGRPRAATTARPDAAAARRAA